MTDPFSNAGLFLINTVFDLYLIVLMTRIILAWARADYFNPLTQIILKLTQPIIKPLQRFIPKYAGIELSTLLVIFVLEIIKFFLIGLIVYGLPTNAFGLFILAGVDILKLFFNTLFYAILFLAIFSWFQSGFSPIARTLTLITSPIMRPIQRVLPPIAGFDLSPIPALIILQLFAIFLVPLAAFGMRVAFG
jgi:YggT family protein